MELDDGHTGTHTDEVVFVLRLRAKERGWYGQVKRLDSGSLRYVAGQTELYALFEGDWQIAVPGRSSSEREGEGE